MEEKKAAEEFRLRQFAGPRPAYVASSANPAFQGLQPPGSLTSAVPLNHHPSQPLPDSTRIILHFDADCFYAQCEELRDSSLRERALGVTQKFLIVTCNYIARARGVTKLMSIKEAQQRCPDLVLINGEDLTPYRHASKSMISVLKRYGPVQKLGLDEIFVDVTAAVEARLQQNNYKNGSAPSLIHGHVHVPGQGQLQQDNKYRPMDLRAAAEANFSTTETNNGNFSNAIENSTISTKMTTAYESFPWWPRIAAGSIIAHEARHAIKTETGLRTSAGIACNKLLSKLSSGLHKPDDQTLLLPCYAADFVHPLPVRALPSVGHKLEADLVAAGLDTVGSLRKFPELQLVEQFGSRVGNFLAFARWGKDTSEVIEQGPPKSVTVEDSFRNCRGYPAAQQVLQVLAPDLVCRLQEEAEDNGRRPTKLILKWRVKGQGWNRTSASCAFPVAALTQPEELKRVAMQLLAVNVKEPFDLTLISIGGTAFVDSNSTNNGTERNIADMLQLLPRSGGGGGGGGRVFQQTESPPAASPALAAGLSLKRRRDYGTGADQAPLSKHAERMLRQQGSSGTAHGTAPAGSGSTKPISGGSQTGYAIDEDEDIDLWDDLADLHDPLHSKQQRNQRPTAVGTGGAASASALVRNGAVASHGGGVSSGDRGGSVYLRHSYASIQSIIIHCDIDSFYCSVERLDDPSLRNVPLAVEQFNSGGFVAVSYEARAAGIRCGDGAGAAGRAAVPHLAAMKARSLEECRIACPGLVVRGMRPQRYREVGRAVHDMLKSVVGPLVQVEKASCDDFYLDITNLCVTAGHASIENIIKEHVGLDFSSSSSIYQSPPDGLKCIHEKEEEEDYSTIWSTLSSDLQIGVWIAHIIRQVLSQKLGLTASCAVARNKLISRLASPINKPDGLTLVPSESAAVSFIGALPIHRVPLLQGKFGAEVQETLKIHLVKDLVNFDQKDLEAKFGPARGNFLSDLPKAIDDTPVAERGPPKSITSERSFPPTKSQGAVVNIIKQLVELLLIRGAEDFVEHHSRLPVKLGVAFRLGYDTNLVSRSVAVPLQLLNWLRASLSTFEFCDGAADAIDAATNAVMALLRGATNGRWDITRAAVVFHYNCTTVSSANGPQQQLFKVAVPVPRKSKDKEIFKKKEENQSLAGPSKVQSIKKQGGSVGGAYSSSTYRNAEALALQAMFSGSGSGSEQVGLPSSYVVNGGSNASEDLDKASLELALKLQREEAEAMASNSRNQSSNKMVKKKQRGPLDNFLVQKPK